MNIVAFRKQYPQYDDVSDIQLSDSLHAKHYSDMPREEFDAQFIAPTLPAPEVDVYGGIDPEGVMAEKAETQKALDFIGGLTEAQMTGPTEGKIGFPETPERITGPTFAGDVVLPTAVGVGETALGMATGVAQLVPEAIKGMGGLLALIGSGNPKRAKAVMEKLSTDITYQPRTEAGKRGMEAVAKPFELLGRGAEAAGEKVLETTAPILGANAGAVLAAMTDATIKAAPLMIPILKKGTRAIKTLPSKIKDSTWFRQLTVKERGLVTLDYKQAKKAGWSEPQLAKHYEEHFTKLVAERQAVETRVVAKKVAEKPVVKPEAPKVVKPKEVVAPEKKVAEIKESPKTQEEITEFVHEKIAKVQRAKPEKAMIKAQHSVGGGIFNVGLEHIGDLSHRITQKEARYIGGAEAVLEKVDRMLGYVRDLDSFGKKIAEQYKGNAKGLELPYDEYIKRVDESLVKYIEEHKKIPVFNEVQELSRDTAIAWGRKDFKSAKTKLETLKKYLDEGQEAWTRRAHEFDIDYSKKLVKEIPRDKEISKGIPSKVKEGEKLVKAKPIEKPSPEKVKTGRVLQKEKEIKPLKPYSVGSSVKVGKSPQVNTILEEMPATKQEKELGERFFKVKNEKTGEVQEVTFEDITPIKLKPIKPEPAAPFKEKVAKLIAEEKGEVTLRQAEAFEGKEVPVWEDIKKMRQSSTEKRKTTFKKVAKELNKAVIDVSGNLKRKALKAGPEGKKVIMRHDLIAGAHSAAIRNVNKATDVIYKGLSEADHDYLDSYLYAKRSLEILKDRPNFKFFGDRKKADFEEMLNSIPPKVRAKVEKRAEKSWDVYNNILKRYHNEGMITKGEYTELTQRGKNYSPREVLEYIDPGAIGGGGKISVPDSGIKALTDEGSLKAIESDSSLLMSQALSRAETRIFRNRAAKSLYDMAKAKPDNGVVSLAKVIRTAKDGKPVYEPAANGFEKISVLIDGQKKEMIMPSDMAKEWIKSDPVLNSNVAETISWLSGTKVLKAMATGLNPEFALTNFPRDLAHVWLTTQEYSKQAPLAALQLTKDIKEVWNDAIFRKGLYNEYIKRGGGMEFLTHQGRFAPKLKGHLGQLQNVMGYAGESSEIAVRLALMQRALKNMKKAGRTDTEAMMDEATWIARNYLDFSQGGSVVKAADTAIPYLNAAIQGTRGVFRAVESKPAETSYKMAQIAAMATGLFYANYYRNKENWDSIPHRDKVNNWIITTPFSYKDKDGNKKWLYVRIPKDQGQRLVTSIAEQVAAKAIGEEVDMTQVTQAAEDFVPISPGALAPPMFKAFKGYELNKDFYRGEDIWRGSREDIKAEEEYYKNYTHDFFIKAGEKTGLSPERLKYALGQYFTSGNVWTSMVGFGWDHLFAEMPEEDQEEVTEELILKKPFIRKLFRHTDPYHKFSKEIKDVTIEERTKKFVMMRDFNDIVQKKLKGTAENKDIVAFIKKNPQDAQVLKGHYKRAILLKDMPEKRYWKELAKIPAPARARLFWSRWQDETPEERIRSLKTAKKISGFYSDAFNRKFGELRSQTMKEEANKGRK